MTWYYIATNSEDHSSESKTGHVELEDGLSNNEEAIERVIEEYPDFDKNLGDDDKYLASFTAVDWNFDSSDFDSRCELKEALVEARGQSSLYAYSQEFGRVKRKV